MTAGPLVLCAINISMLYYYNGQIRRYITQFIRLFSGFQYQTGKNADGITSLVNVPVKYAETNRQASQILKNNSEASLISAPMISCYITDLSYNRERMQDPNFVSKMHIREREWDSNFNQYTNWQGEGYTIERLMPVPYEMKMNADIFTTNTDQKLQIFEQITVLFNPALEIQSTSNYVDWTSLSYVELDTVNFSSRTIPIGTDDAIDVCSLSFNIPIWLSPPAKVKKLGVVQTIIASVFDESGILSGEVTSGNFLTKQYVTPTNMGILIVGNEIRLLNQFENVTEPNTSLEVPEKRGTLVDWIKLVDAYGKLVDGVSQIRLTQPGGTDIIGTVSYHPVEPWTLLYNPDVDTLPTNTLTAITAIVDPIQAGPNHGLPAAVAGQRYLLVDDIGDANNAFPATAWGPVAAKANDIIQYNGTNWTRVFDSENALDVEYVTNAITNMQYKWTGSAWVKSYEGEYRPGEWTLVL